MSNHALAETVQKHFAAFMSGDRQVVEKGLAPDFTFTSPYDDHIDRATYFERCWPNRERIAALHIEKIITDGNTAFVLYECKLKSGGAFRNTEFFTFDGEKMKSVEVYFGDPPAGVSKNLYAGFLSAAVDAWNRKAFTVTSTAH
jgi:ketosteroid isomerase-like protein